MYFNRITCFTYHTHSTLVWFARQATLQAPLRRETIRVRVYIILCIYVNAVCARNGSVYDDRSLLQEEDPIAQTAKDGRSIGLVK